MNQRYSRSRRDFIKNSSLTASMLPFIGKEFFQSDQKDDGLSINIFSKHLQFLDFREMAQVAADIGFDGVDLTVRPKGHIEPADVEAELPKAILSIKNAGLRCPMITTAVEHADRRLDRLVLEVAAANRVRFYRCNWFKYRNDVTMEEDLDRYGRILGALSALNKDLNITGCYQNHAGTSIGSSLWEINSMLKHADPQFFGVQYDIRHAVVEGGLSWQNGLNLIKDHIKTIVLKDFRWEKGDEGWKVVNTPIGQGMVDFKKYFRLLKKHDINVPVSLHVEYPIGGAEHGDRTLTIAHEKVYEAMRDDLNNIRYMWKHA